MEMLLLLLLVLGSVGALLAALRYLWRLASGEDQRRRLHELDIYAQVAIERARHQHPLPAHTYSPHLTYSPHTRTASAPVSAVASPAPADAPTVPSFAELLQMGHIGRDPAGGRRHPLILGYAPGGAVVEGAWLDVYSSALAGMPHSGKTTSQRFLACQLVLRGAQFVVADPHRQAGDDSLAATLEPLRSRYLCEPADTPATILEAIKYVDSIGQRRIGGDPDRTPIVLWIDELNGLLVDATIGPELLRLLQATARQYRKVWVCVSAVAHTWSASSTGGTSDLRATFASRLCHRMERSQARLLLPADLATRTERLEPGQAVLHSLRHSTVLTVPHTTARDVQTVAGYLRATTSGRTRPPDGAANRPVTEPSLGGQPGDTPAARAASLTTQEARILALARAATPISRIVEEIWGVKGGSKYQERAGEVMRVIAQQLPDRPVGGPH